MRPQLFLLLAVLAGCSRSSAPAASSTTPSPTTTESGGVSPSFGEQDVTGDPMITATNELSIALDAGASCDLVGALRDRICGLAQRICDLSAETPEDSTMRAQCADGASRCLAATESVRNRCGP